MRKKEMPTNKLSIYLIKEKYTELSYILKKNTTLDSTEIKDVGTFYYSNSHQFRPEWIKDFFGISLDGVDIFSASAKGLLLVKTTIDSHERIFALTFGHGWTFLRPGVFEERFGLKTTLNIIDPENLRRVNKKNMSSTPKDTSEQLTKAGVASDFGIDIEQDLICSITGKSSVADFGKTLTGKDSLTVSTKVDLSSIKNFLVMCYDKYNSKDYKKNFEWIDQIAEIKDPKLLEYLDEKMISDIKNGVLEKTWMAVPEIIDWEDISGFKYKDNKKSERYDDIHLGEFIKNLSEDEKDKLSLDTFRKNIYCFDRNGDTIIHQWKAYNCLYSEVKEEKTNNTYLLSNGKWYEIEKEFAKQVNDDYQDIKSKKTIIELPNYKNKDENDYNIETSKVNSELYSMDRKNISYGGGYSKIEFCDLYSKNKKLIHVKYYGGSSVLSHLFSQGVVSGELFISDSKFREKVNEKLPNSHKLLNTEDKPKATEYDVIFGIISHSKKDLEIPFFSKVTLKNARKRLEAYGYKVYLQKIESDTTR